MRLIQYMKLVKNIMKTEKKFLKGLSRVLNSANILLQRKVGFSMPLSFGTPRDGLYYPEGIERLSLIKRIYEVKEIHYIKQKQKINIFIPNISSDLIFGGYISLYNLLNRFIEQGFELRLIICDQILVSDKNLRKQFKEHKLVGPCLQKSEIGHWTEIEKTTFGYDDISIGYSWVTMNYASQVAEKTSYLPLFFIQEYESIFYAYDSFRALCDQTYSLPHKAIFNSRFLTKFFKEKRLGIFENDKNSENYVCFEHTFADLDKPNIDVLSNRKKKKLLFYARPENHAARNLFELTTFALIKAIEQGIFDDSWEFYGIGSLKPILKLELANGHYLQMLPRVSFDEYKKMLGEFDIGLCPMYAPHPSVPPFEMASAGLISITTTFENRSKADVESISGNIIACKPMVHELVNALKLAKEKSNDFENRVKYSQFDWSRDWKDSFSEDFMNNLKRLIDAK